MRIFNRCLAVVCASAVMAAGAIGAVEIAFGLLGRPAWIIPRDRWDRALLQAAWDDRAVTAVLVALTVTGGLLFIAQLWPRRPLAFDLHCSDRRPVSIAAAGLEHRLAEEVHSDPHVLAASARVTRRGVNVVAAVPGTESPDGLTGRLQERVRRCLRELGVDQTLRPTVKLEHREGRVR